MTRLRYDHILAGTALALILAAIPAGSLAQNADKAAPLPAAAAEQQATEAPVANPTLAAPTVAIDPLASLDPADRPFAEKIRDFFAASSDRIFTNKKERAAAEAFYQSRNYAPLWLDKGIENARAISAIARLKNADADGLESSDYKIPTFAGLAPEALAEADLKLTQTVLTYARHVQAGRVP
jgi:murein L,D-transpeptidase YcbB/YkuD